MESLPTPSRLQVRKSDMERMHLDVAQRAPEEACGLLSGWKEPGTYRAIKVFPLQNVLHSLVRFRLDPYDQFKVFNEIDSLGLELVGIYHSHPCGPDTPSPTDIKEAYYPDAVQLIWSFNKGIWRCKSFVIREKLVTDIELLIS